MMDFTMDSPTQMMKIVITLEQDGHVHISYLCQEGVASAAHGVLLQGTLDFAKQLGLQLHLRAPA